MLGLPTTLIAFGYGKMGGLGSFGASGGLGSIGKTGILGKIGIILLLGRIGLHGVWGIGAFFLFILLILIGIFYSVYRYRMRQF
jgi:hypothetical protein